MTNRVQIYVLKLE